MKQSSPHHDVGLQIARDEASLARGDSTAVKKKRRSKIGSVLISGVGFLADAYDLFVIDFVLAILVATAEHEATAGDKGLIVSSTLAGAVAGQLFFGIAADFIGRRVMFITTAALVICGSLLSAVVGQGYQAHDSAFSIYQQLAVCRFFLGFGIGGEYPLSATVASETESEEELAGRNREETTAKGCLWYLEHKPNSIAAVFSMQGVGMLLSPLFVMFCISVGMSLEATWRFCLGIGAIPSAVAFIFRWRMHETAAFKKTQRDYSMAESTTTAITALPKYPNAVPGAPSSVSDASYDHKDATTTTTDVSPIASPQQQKKAKEQQLVAAAVVPVGPPAPQRSAHSDLGDLVTSPKEHNRFTWKAFGKHLKRSWRTLVKFRWILLGTSATWFLIDVTLYGTGSFKSAVVGSWFIESTPAPSTAASARVLLPDVSGSSSFSSEVRRPLEFFESRAQTQRDTLRYLLGSVLDATTSSSTQGRNNAKRLLRDANGDDYDKVMVQAQMATIVALLAIPGYFLSLFLIHKTGTKQLQLWGFFAVAAVFTGLGIEQLCGGGIRALELILFGLTFLCSNFGPNTTTFILPTQLYPTLVRATCHGFSAAMGKLGGVVGTSLFSVLQQDIGLGWLLVLCSAVAILGAAFTLLIPNDAAAKERLTQDEVELARRHATRSNGKVQSSLPRDGRPAGQEHQVQIV